MCRMGNRFIIGVACIITSMSIVTSWAQDEGPARWEEDIRAFEAADQTNAPPQEAILFLGSSSIRLWDLENAFPGLPVINRGFGGSHTEDALYYADRIVYPYAPRIIVFYEGDNDLAAGKTPRRVVSDFEAFVERVQGWFPHTHIVFLSIKPSIDRWAIYPTMQETNRRIEMICQRDERLLYADLASPLLNQAGQPDPRLYDEDELHLNENGYARWNQTLRPLLHDLWQEVQQP